MKGFILFLIAYVLFIPLTVINVIVVLVKRDYGSFSGYFRDSALRLDIYGCSELRTLWNTIFITKDGIRFGKSGFSISHDLGANQANGTLSKVGKALVWILDKIDKDHCKLAYEKYV